MKITPTKRFKNKKLPIRINMTKKYPLAGDAPNFGPRFSPYMLMALYMYVGQFSIVARANNVIIAFGTES